jgi:hypothetical protein
MPGKYTVRLTVGGQVYEQPLTVRMDPRVKTPEEVLREQFQLSFGCWRAQRSIRATLERIQAVRRQIADRRAKADDELKKELASADEKLAIIAGSGGGGGRRGAPRSADPSLARAAADLASLQATLQAADAEPTTTVREAVPATLKATEALHHRLEDLRTKSLPRLNEKLRQAGLAELTLEKQQDL